MLDEVINIHLRSGLHISSAASVDDASWPDDALVQSVLEGDEAAFRLIFERHRRLVTATASRFFRDPDDVMEMVQQSFAKAYFSLSKYRGGEEHSLSAWVTRITVNVCYDEYRRRQRKGLSLFSEIGDDERNYVESILDRRERSPEAKAADGQLAERILSALPPEDRAALVLVYSEEYPLEEAAAMLGISSSSLKSRLFRCRNTIKRRFGHLFR